MTCRRDRLPKEIPETNLHKKKTDSSPRPKAARFFNPINAVKKVPAADDKKGYQRCLFSTSDAADEQEGGVSCGRSDSANSIINIV